MWKSEKNSLTNASANPQNPTQNKRQWLTGLQRAAAQQDAGAHTALLRYHLHEQIDLNRVYELCESRCARGPIDAQSHFLLARMLDSGNPRGKNLAQASQHYAAAVHGKHPQAALYMAEAAVAQGNYTATRQHYETAANQHPDAQFYLALMLIEGKGGAKDWPRALALLNTFVARCTPSSADHTTTDTVEDLLEKVLSRLSSRGRNTPNQKHTLYANAHYRLAVMHKLGQGTPVNYAAAITHYTEAAEYQHKDALYELGMLYEEGRGVKRNTALAKTYYQRARDAGHSLATLRLSLSYQIHSLFRFALTMPSDQETQQHSKQYRLN